MKAKIITVGLSGAIAVALGALGAHFLKAKMNAGLITADQLAGFETGVRYHMYHTIAMLALLVWSSRQPGKWLNWAYACFFWGIVLFSGSLYVLCTRGLSGAEWLKVMGPITPVGGLVLIAGWVLVAVHGIKNQKQD